jgi:hypothetical protein
MTKQETAKQIVTQLIKALQNKNYIKRLTFSKYGLTQYEPDVLDEDLEQLLDIAQDSIEEYVFLYADMTARQRRFVDAILSD